MSTDAAMRVERILVVDDNAANRQVAEGHLVAAGYAVQLAEGGEQGIAACQEWQPDLVLLDILMPGMDGFETCKHLKNLPAGKDVPVVFLTALNDLRSHQQAMESGADDFLTKPINRTELLIRVRSLLWIRHLREELDQGYDLIRSQRDALVRAQHQKEELSALVVHDLKNPLGVILGNAHFLSDEPHLREQDREVLRDIVTAAESMHRMVMNLLDISRSEDGTLVPNLAEVDLGRLIEEVCERARRRSDEMGLAINLASDSITILTDESLIQRLVENLLDNCIKYVPRNGVINVRAAHSDGSFVEIRVDDDGPGVPPEYRDKIFDKYVQVEHDVEAHGRTSRGLGLAFCRLAAEAHGGQIWVEENRPQGASFCVRLPVAP